jgi:hypothetical protein
LTQRVVTETPYRYSSSVWGFGYTPVEVDDDPLPSPTVRAVAEEDADDGWTWLRVESQRWES